MVFKNYFRFMKNLTLEKSASSVAAVEFISNDFCVKDGTEVLKVFEHVFVLPAAGDLADK
jgi:hypothetical protein